MCGVRVYYFIFIFLFFLFRKDRGREEKRREEKRREEVGDRIVVWSEGGG